MLQKGRHISPTVLIFSFIAHIALTQAAAQSLACRWVIEGVVRDNHAEPIAGATLYIPELKQGTISDSLGRFRLVGACMAGACTLQCSLVGYATTSETISLKGTQYLSLILPESAQQLSEIVVQERAIRREDEQTFAIQTLYGDKLARAQGGSLATLLQGLSGISLLQSGSNIAKPVLDGLHSNRLLILNNGIRQEGQQWGSEHAPEIDPFVAEKITVIRGAAAVQYGAEAIAGVILVEPADLPYTQKHWQGNLQTVAMSNGRGGAVSGQVARGWGNGWAFRLQASSKYLGDVQSPHYVLSNTGTRELNFSAALGYRHGAWQHEVSYSQFSTSLGILRAAHTGSRTDLQNAIDAPQPLYIRDFTYNIDNPRQRVAHHLLKVKGKYLVNDRSHLTWQYGLQLNRRREFDIRRGGRSNTPVADMVLLTNTLDVGYQIAPRANWQILTGVSLLYQHNFSGSNTGVRPLVPQYMQGGAGVFWIAQSTRPRWNWELGMRYEGRWLRAYPISPQGQPMPVSDFGFQSLVGSAGLVYQHRGLVWRTNIASAWRPPNVAELFSQGLHHGTAAIEEGILTQNPNHAVRTERSYKLITQLQWNGRQPASGRGIEWEGSLFCQEAQNFIYLSPSEIRTTIRGAFAVWDYRYTTAHLWGGDVAVRAWGHKHWYAQVRGNLLAVRDVGNRGFLPMIPANQLSYGVHYQGKSSPKIGNIYASLSMQTVFRQTRSPQIISPEALINYQTTETPLPTVVFDYLAPPPRYHLLHLEFGFTWRNYLNLGVEVQNTLNVAYRSYTNRFRYFADEAGRNVLLRLKYLF